MSKEISKALKLSGLYAITDPILLPGEKLIGGVESALRGGAQIIQYRDKTATETQRIRDASKLRAITRQYGALLLINDDVELCHRVQADGVHLGRSDGDIRLAKTRLGADKIVGVTCHADINYAHQAIQLGADYCAFGRIFASQTKPDAPHCPLEILSEAAKLPCPTVAIGGINPDNASRVLRHHVNMIAVIHGLFGQADIESSARWFSRLFPHA